MDFDPYKVLKVDPSADEEVIAAAYRALSKKYHPDLNKSPEAQNQMQQVNRAYDMLRDPASRKKVDEDLSRRKQNGDGVSNYSNVSGNRPGYGQTGGYSPRYSTPSRSYNTGDVTGKRNDRTSVHIPDDNTFFLYQKRLVDDKEHKLLRVGVYHDKIYGKICNINATAPDVSGRVNSGSVFLQSLEMFDLTDAVNEALAVMEKPVNPIEANSDHNVYFRKKISGLQNTYLVVEVVKNNKAEAKQAILFLGERRGDGVAAIQNEKQLRQIERILTEAFATMR
jgi:hypothetical protein